LQRVVGLLERQTVAQPAHHMQPRARGCREILCALKRRERNRHLGREPRCDAEEPTRGDTDDREDLTVDPDRSSEDPAVASETAQPARVADHRDRTVRATRDPIIVGTKEASGGRLNTQRRVKSPVAISTSAGSSSLFQSI
jgi:hypothetical protein